jgi:tripartite-type tricarboxylate transporter receptor subunit TctC
MHRRRFNACLTGALALPALPATSQQGWPARPLRIVVPFATGSTNDVMARQLAPMLAEGLGQSVIVENRAGGGGVLGTEAVVRAAPDGYTLGLGTSSQLVMNPALMPKLPFDIERDLTTIGLIARSPLLLAGRRDGPQDLQSLIALARTRPGTLTYGSGGTGSISHIVGESFARTAGVELLHVPYKGNGPAMTDLVGGQIDLVFDGFTQAGPMMRAGQCRILAVSREQRHPDYPEIPTFAQAGLPGYEAYTWNCLIAPRATPRPIVERLNRELNRALATAEIRRRLESSGAENLGGATPEAAEAFGEAQRARWVPAVRAMNIRLD